MYALFVMFGDGEDLMFMAMAESVEALQEFAEKSNADGYMINECVQKGNVFFPDSDNEPLMVS